MGGKGGVGQAQKNISADADQLTSLAKQQQGQSTQLFNQSMPGFGSAESFYSSLASGDPTQIARAISPATQQISAATTGAKQNIMQNDPSGGEKNLALDQANLNQGAQVGSTASQGYLNSFNALAKLAGQGIGQSQSGANSAISGFGSSISGNNASAQLGIQQKGATLGALGGLASDATGLLGASSGASAGSKAGAAGLGLLFA